MNSAGKALALLLFSFLFSGCLLLFNDKIIAWSMVKAYYWGLHLTRRP